MGGYFSVLMTKGERRSSFCSPLCSTWFGQGPSREAKHCTQGCLGNRTQAKGPRVRWLSSNRETMAPTKARSTVPTRGHTQHPRWWDPRYAMQRHVRSPPTQYRATDAPTASQEHAPQTGAPAQPPPPGGRSLAFRAWDVLPAHQPTAPLHPRHRDKKKGRRFSRLKRPNGFNNPAEEGT